ncbi:MAG: GGDEF domain-containing protein, partial [Cyanobacteria bacterium J06555_13]
EFLVLLHGTSAPEARQVAEELRGAIAQLQSIPDYPVTVSAGVAELQPSESWQAWMKRSDESLYRAKQSGRNRVEV